MLKNQFLFGLNAGGLAYIDGQGNLYEADTTGVGNIFRTNASIAGTTDDVLYQSESWSAQGLTYEVAVTAGTYFVELHFAEIFFSAADKREFDILLEGARVVDDLDIHATVGKNTALSYGFFVEVTDGALTLQLAPELQNPKLSAFSVWSVTGLPDPDLTVPKAEISVNGGATATDPVTVTVTYSDDTQLDVTTIGLSDLQITGAGSYRVLSQSLTILPDGTSATAVYTLVQDGGWSTDPVRFSVADGAVSDAAGNGNAAVSQDFTRGHPFDGIAPVDSYGEGAVGSAEIRVTSGSGVQSSTFGSGSFGITNTGDKRIAAVHIDISEALLTDAVFDPLGLAGDNVARGVFYGATGRTGAVPYAGADVLVPFYGTGGAAGYEGLMIRFDAATDGGFETGETVSFGVDVDPNSILGIPQSPTDTDGADPRLNGWDIGGVSGAELIGATVEILFTDGTVARGQLIGDGSQGGAVAAASEASPGLTATLTVNGTAEGGSGIWGATNSVIVDGPAGATARIVMVTGFAQPFDYIAPDGSPISTYDRLVSVQDPFLANNALKVQTIDVTLTGGPQDITALFDFSPPGGALAFEGNDSLPVAFAASVLNADGLPAGPVSAPIYLQPGGTDGPRVTIDVTPATSAIAPVTVTVSFADTDGIDPATLSPGDLVAMLDGVALDVLWQGTGVAPDGLTATATFYLMPEDRVWTPGDTVEFSVGAGAVRDLTGAGNPAAAATYDFEVPEGPEVDSLADMTQLALQGVSLNNPTSIDIGADGRLYVSQQNGLIVALTVARSVTNDTNGVPTETWAVTAREDITLVRDMPNHNDVGIYQPGVLNRQVTGIVTTTDAGGNIVIYVSSSDPRIGGGGSGDDKDLDTNSGILSRLTQQPDGGWEKLDLVRGLPRSVENHSTNGLVLTKNAAGEDVLLLAVGGFTNTGAQSNNFAYTPEYYYAASVVEIDLGQLRAMEEAGQIGTYTPPGATAAQRYLYDLPTLDDISRVNGPDGDLAGDGSVTADVFGGNKSLNQAIHDPMEIVKVVYAGFRNNYDLVVTPAGEVYTVDNGSNAGWGGVTVNAAGEPLVDTDGDGLADNGPGVNIPNETGGANADSLLRLDGNVWQADATMYYGGHPNLYRAYSADAGVYLFADSTNPWGVPAGTPLDFVGGVLTPTTAPVDLVPHIPNALDISGVDAFGQPLIDPQQALHLGTGTRAEGLTDTPNGALYTFFSSTNGLDVYEGAGAMQGNLITVSFNGKIYSIAIGPDGKVSSVEDRALTSSPLDVVAQGALDPYPGVIFVVAYGADQIVILSPDTGKGVLPDPNDRDQDGIDDTIDPFAADPANGLLDPIGPGRTMLWTFANGATFPNDRDSLFDGTGGLYNGGDIGFTGIMTNRGGLPESLYVQDNIIFGGAPGVLQVKEVESGDATTDSQRNGFQLGTTVGAGTTAFTVSSLIDNYLDEIGDIPATEKLSQGIFIGAGDQNNFVSVSLVRLADGRTGFEVVSQFSFDFIGETPPATAFYQVPQLNGVGALDAVELFLDVDVASAAVTPRWSFDLGNATFGGAGAPVTLQGDALKALDGSLVLPDDSGGFVPVGLAVGLLSSRTGTPAGPPATITAFSAGGDETFTAMIDGVEVTFVPDTQAAGVTITGLTKTFGVNELTNFAGTDLDELHTEERFALGGAAWGYDIATGNGTFEVDLYFADIWGGTHAPGARVFDVVVEGRTVAEDLDLFSEVGGNAEYVLTVDATVTDGILDIDFFSVVQNAKISAVLVREPGTLTGSFAADWDELRIEGYGTPPADVTAPAVAISLDGGVVADDPVTVTVRYSDGTELDITTLSLSDLSITGAGSYTILSETLTIAPDNASATAVYSVLQDRGWTSDPVSFGVAAGAVADTSGNLSAAVGDLFLFDEPGGDVFVFALNAGGGEFTAADGTVYAADTYGAGNPFKTVKTIAGTEDDALYQTETWKKNGFTYDIPIANGTYRVDLHFAEIFGPLDQPGERVFDLYLEDVLILDDFDIVAAAPGQFTAHVHSAMVEVTDGSLTLRTASEVENPKLSAFSVWIDDDMIA